MNRTKEIQYDEKTLPEYVAELLTLRTSSLFFPVNFIYGRGTCEGIYDVGSFKPLSAMKEISIYDLLTALCSLLRGIVETEKCYLYAEGYAINLQTVYVNPINYQVKMIFLPVSGEFSLKHKLHALMSGCKSMVSEEGMPYLEDMIAYMDRENAGCLGLVRHGEILQNEIYTCDIQ